MAAERLPAAGGLHDVRGLLVGHWTDAAAGTGCTVVLAPPEGAIAAVSVRGGAPGTRETDALARGNVVERVNAVLLTGGSAFGLNAAGGVMRWLEEHGRGFETRAGRVPIVPAAVLYDLHLGDAAVRPGEREGYLACEAAAGAEGRPLCEGSVGAGTGATVAKTAGLERALKGGIGTAAERLADGTVVAALAAVNAVGDVFDVDAGRLIAWPRPDEHGQRPAALDILRQRAANPPAAPFNTTLVVVATDATLTREDAYRVAEMANAGLARAIVPCLSPGDGDAVFALATCATPCTDLLAVGAMAALATARAIARAVRAATGLHGVPAVRDLER